MEKYRLLSEEILNLLKKREYDDIPVQAFNYEYKKGILKLMIH
jgi:hypothetical protein